jgi:hypothetical protein
MADKELFRPVGLDPSWANDTLLNDPGETWDATATKVEPGAGKRDDGFLPNEQPPAQHVNQLFNEIGKWIQFFSNIQIQNWDPPKSVTVAGTNSSYAVTRDTNPGGSAASGRGNWMVAGFAGVITESPDGMNWSSVSGAGSALTWAASKDPRDAPVLTTSHCSVFGGNTPVGNNTVVDYIGTTKTTRALSGSTGSTVTESGIWANDSGIFVVGGTNGALAPALWWNDPSSMSTPWNAGTGVTYNDSTSVVDVAHDPDSGLTVAVGNKGTTHADIWTSTDGKAWTLVADVFTDEPTAIDYNKKTGLWMVAAGATGKIYTSSDGTTWSLLTTLGFQVRHRCLLGVGSVWALVEDGSYGLYHSTDGGATWRYQFVDGDSKASTTTECIDITYAEDVGCFGIALTGGYPSPSDDGQFRKSLSAGTLLATASGSGYIVLDNPTVT